MSKKGEEREWVRVAGAFEASGLTQREFAQSRGLRLSTLQSWIYRRRRRVSTEAPRPVRLLPVQEGPAPRAAKGERVEVATASGLRVRFTSDTEVDYESPPLPWTPSM